MPGSLARMRAPTAVDSAAADDNGPERLRELAETAFAQSKLAPALRKVANGRAPNDGWEEF